MNVYYIIIIISVVFFVFSYDKYTVAISNLVMYSFFSVFLIVLAGARENIATDYGSYKQIFLNQVNIDRIEPGFKLLILLFKKLFGTSFHGFVFLVALLSVSIKIVLYNKLPNKFLALLIYISLFFINIEFNVIRQGLAIGVIFLAFFCGNKNKLLFCGLIIIASSIHVSSLVFLILNPWLLERIKWNKYKIIVTIVFFFIIRIFFINALISGFLGLVSSVLSLPPIVQQLMNYFQIGDFKITFGFLRRLCIIIVFILLNKNNEYGVSFTFCLISLCLNILFMGNDIFAYRISLCFDVFLIPLFGYLRFQRTSTNTILVFSLCVVLVVLFLLPLQNGYAVPYQSII